MIYLGVEGSAALVDIKLLRWDPSDGARLARGKGRTR